jgi:hypothetical protein
MLVLMSGTPEPRLPLPHEDSPASNGGGARRRRDSCPQFDLSGDQRAHNDVGSQFGLYNSWSSCFHFALSAHYNYWAILGHRVCPNFCRPNL